jgi:hypothetical protein
MKKSKGFYSMSEEFLTLEKERKEVVSLTINKYQADASTTSTNNIPILYALFVNF